MNPRGFGLATAVVAAVGLGSPGIAAAEVIGPCEAAINDVDVTHRSASNPADAVEVDVDDTVTVSIAATRSTGSWTLGLEFAGVALDLNDGPGAAGRFTAAADIAEYAIYGVGLYRVVGFSELCEGAALVNVTGRSPLTTVAGAGGLGLATVGLVVPVLTGRRRMRASSPGGAGLVLGMGTGALGGFGGLVLAQQYALAYPTALTTGVAVAAGALLGGAAASLGGRGKEGGPSGPPPPASGQAATADRPEGTPTGTPPGNGTWDAPPPPAPSPTHRVPDTGLDVYPSPDPAEVPDSELQAGAPVHVLERHGDWARVQTGDGATGWIDARDLDELGQ